MIACRYLFLALFVAVFFSYSQSSNNKSEYQLVIKLKPEFADSIHLILKSSFLKKSGFEIKKSEKYFANHLLKRKQNKNYKIRLDLIYKINVKTYLSENQTIEKIRNLPIIEYVHADIVINAKPLYFPSDTYSDTIMFKKKLGGDSAGGAWYLKKINAFKAWDLSKGDSNTVTALVDWGTNFNHEDIGNYKININDPIDGFDNDNNGYIDDYRGWDFGNNDNNPTEDPCYPNHGTKVAGMCSATPDNGKGITGIGYNCKYMSIKLNSNGSCTVPALIDALLYAVESGVKVMNLSLDVGGNYPIIQDLINYAVFDKNIVVVAAAGNSGNGSIVYPASHENVLAVSGSDINDCKWNFGNYNYWIDVSVPIVNVYLPYQNGYAYEIGSSSFCAPMVSGMAALLQSYRKDLNARQIMEMIRVTCKPFTYVNSVCGALSPGNFIEKIGKGVPDLYKAMKDSSSLAVRYQSHKLIKIAGSDSSKLYLTLENLLYPTSNLKINIRSMDANVKVLDSIRVFGIMNMFATKENTISPFVLSIASGLPNNYQALFRIGFSDTLKNYSDYQYIYVSLNQTFADININAIKLSTTSNGRLGYTSFSQAEGNGFSAQNAPINPLFYECGLMIGQSTTKVADCVFNVGATNSESDFTTVKSVGYKQVNYADQYTESIINDSLMSGKIGIQVTQKTFAFSSPPNNKFIILEYSIKNTNATLIDSLKVGLFTQWSIMDPTYNKAYYDCAYKLGYFDDGFGTVFTGLVSLTNNKNNWFVMNNANIGTITGNINPLTEYSTFNKFKSLTMNRLSDVSQSANGLSSVISNTIYQLQPGASQTVAFALLSGSSLTDIKNSALAAQNKFKSLKAGALPQVNDTIFICNTSIANNLEIKPLNGAKFNFYNTSLPCSLPIYSGRAFTLTGFSVPGFIYVSNADSITESALKKVVILKDTVYAGFTFPNALVAFDSVKFLNSNTIANTTYEWNLALGTTTSITSPIQLNIPAGVFSINLTSIKLSGCRATSSKVITINPAFANFKDTLIQFPKEGSTVPIIIQSNTSWVITDTIPWLILNTLSGKGNATLTGIVSQANKWGFELTGALTMLSKNGIKDTLKVIQKGEVPYLSVENMSCYTLLSKIVSCSLRPTSKNVNWFDTIKVRSNLSWKILADTSTLYSLISDFDTTYCNCQNTSKQDCIWYFDNQNSNSSKKLWLSTNSGVNDKNIVILALTLLKGHVLTISGGNIKKVIYINPIPIFSRKDTTDFCIFSSNYLSKANYFSISPNPASNLININFTSSNIQHLTLNISITDLFGKSTPLSFMNSESESLELDVSQFPPGIYMLQIQSDNHSETHKLIIQK
ncbi:MAG: S8 family serine peptidase [Bacteroidota bacterium]|nr:S8 family serine peptidase [Bacteroidota bacterium]